MERLINRHKDAVYRQLIRTCGNQDDAEDALADALLSAIKASEQLNDPANFQAWLAKIGARACARIRIKERMLSSVSLADLEARGFEIPSQDASPATEHELTMMKGCVAAAIESLPDLYREVYLRREIRGDMAQDVAAQMGLSVSAIKSRLHRARELMRASLDSGLGCGNLA